MPKYVYRCSKCKEEFEIVHGMFEKQQECTLCLETECLTRIPQMTSIKTFESDTSEKHKVGTHVKNAIEDNATLLKEMRQKAKSQEYEDDN